MAMHDTCTLMTGHTHNMKRIAYDTHGMNTYDTHGMSNTAP